MSKLLDKLEKLSKGNPVPMGFGVSLARQGTDALLVIGILLHQRAYQLFSFRLKITGTATGGAA